MAGRAPKPEAGANVSKDLPGRGCHGAPGEGLGHRWMVHRCASDTREGRGPGGVHRRDSVMEESPGAGGGWSRELRWIELWLDVCSERSPAHRGSECPSRRNKGRAPRSALLNSSEYPGGRLASATRSCHVSCASSLSDLEAENTRSLLVRAGCTRPPTQGVGQVQRESNWTAAQGAFEQEMKEAVDRCFGKWESCSCSSHCTEKGPGDRKLVGELTQHRLCAPCPCSCPRPSALLCT